MLILSNALTDVVDEGCVKIANNLVKRIKAADASTKVIAFDRQSDLADEHLTVNKLFINKKLLSKLKNNNSDVMYIPFPAKTFSNAFRVFVLSLFAGKNFRVVLSMTDGMSFFSKLLLKWSRARITVFSKRSFELYSKVVGEENVDYLKVGVDTDKFVPVSKERANELKKDYGFDTDKKLVLHVGHLNRGRNVQQLKKLSEEYQVLLIASTQTKHEQDNALKDELISCGVKIIDTYIPNIEQIYQMSDVYFFPVSELGNCIDVPLSCIEAAACNKPVVTTDFGEMRELVSKDGFYCIDSFDADALKAKLRDALSEEPASARLSVLDYDWRFATEFLLGVK